MDPAFIVATVALRARRRVRASLAPLSATASPAAVTSPPATALRAAAPSRSSPAPRTPTTSAARPTTREPAWTTSAGLPAAQTSICESSTDPQAAIDALRSGGVDIYIGNDLIATQDPRTFRLTAALPAVDQGIGIAKSHPELKRAIATALQAMFTDGTDQAILEKYGASQLSIASP